MCPSLSRLTRVQALNTESWRLFILISKRISGFYAYSEPVSQREKPLLNTTQHNIRKERKKASISIWVDWLEKRSKLKLTMGIFRYLV